MIKVLYKKSEFEMNDEKAPAAVPGGETPPRA